MTAPCSTPCFPPNTHTHTPHPTLGPADEHYFGTLFAVLGREAEMECGSWGVAAQDWSRGGAHPKSFRC